MKTALKMSYKISLISMLITMVAVLAATTFYGFSEYRHAAEKAEEQMRVLGEVTAFSIAAPSMFGDAQAANAVLDALSINVSVISARLTTSDDNRLAEYQRSSDNAGAELKHLTIPVRWKSQNVGKLALAIDTSGLKEQLYRQIRLSFLLAFTAVALAGLVVQLTVHRLTKPFRRLSDVADKIVSQKDYSLRATAIATGDEVGNLTHAFNTMLDYIEVQNTALQASQEILASNEQRLMLATTAAGLGVWDYQVGENLLLWDERMCNMYEVEHTSKGQTAEAWLEKVHVDDRAKMLADYKHILKGGNETTSVFRIICPGGAIKYMKSNTIVLRDTDGFAVRMLGVNLDVTTRELTQVALKSAESLAQEMLAEANLANTELSFQKRALDEHAIVSIANVRGEILYANDKFCEISGYSRVELMGKNNRLVVSDTCPLECLEGIRLAIIEGTPWSGDMANVKKNGDIYWVSATVISSINDAGEPASYIVIATDITEVRRAEAMLRRSQKMESVGELAGGLAHDFNNLLGIIIGNLDLMSAQDHLDKALRSQLDIAQTAALRGSILTRSLLDFSSRSEGDYSPVDVGRVISNFEELIRKSITASISLETYLPLDLFSVELNPDDLEDALINLSLNARDAMPNGGSLIIQIQNRIMDDITINSEVEVEPGEYLEISISDTGVGMSEEVYERIFDPFFTTKGKAEGTGLGLAMVYGFVKRVNGYIFVFSEIGRGATFTIYLPRSKLAVKRQEVPARVASIKPSGIETILIVDDEVELAVIAKSVLEDIGYTVVCVNNGPAALEVLEKDTTIDLVFSDVVMPGGMSGLDLAAIIAKEYPDLKILLTTGYAAGASNSAPATEPDYEMLRKPYRGIELARRVRKALDDNM